MPRTWRIGEVAQRTGLTRRTLRHYDDLGLLVPSGRSWSDYRLYDSDDLMRLLQIQSLKALGLSLSEIADALDDPSVDAATTLRSHRDLLTERIAAEQKLATQLDALAESSERSWEDVLEAIALTQLQTHVNPVARLRAALLPAGRATDELFAALVVEEDLAVQEVLVWALASRPGVTELALAALKTARPALRATLARLIGKAKESTGVPALVELLDDAEPTVRLAAANALSILRPAAAAGPLASLLGTDGLPQAAVIDALVAIGAAAVAPAAAVLATGDEDAQLAAAEALGGLAGTGGDVEAICAALGSALQRGSLMLRRSVLVELSALGDPGRALVDQLRFDPELGSIATRLLE